MSKLFEPFKLGNIELKNRIVMSPMTRSRATANHIPTPIMAEYYGQRATAGLIITEGVGPSKHGTGYARTPGLYSAEQVEAWKPVTKAVHEKGSKIFAQIMHTGRVSHPLNMDAGSQVVAPSAIGLSTTKMWTDQENMVSTPVPKEMTSEEIKETVAEFVAAAKNAVAAGFDGVEIHGANGYLVEQFISASSNIRTDEYGGSIENRARFALEVAEGMVKAIGKERVGIRLSPFGAANDMKPYPEIEATYEYLARELGKLELAYLHIVDHSAMGAPEVPDSIKQKMRSEFGGTVILAGGYNRDAAEAVVENDDCELVAFGRLFISNPDLVLRLKKNLELTSPNPNLFYSPGAEGYTDYPFATAA